VALDAKKQWRFGRARLGYEEALRLARELFERLENPDAETTCEHLRELACECSRVER